MVHAPSSLANHPLEIGELAGGAALAATPFLLPELLGAGAGAGGEALLGGGVGGLPADLSSYAAVGDVGADPFALGGGIPTAPSVGGPVSGNVFDNIYGAAAPNFTDAGGFNPAVSASGGPASPFDVTGGTFPQQATDVTAWNPAGDPFSGPGMGGKGAGDVLAAADPTVGGDPFSGPGLGGKGAGDTGLLGTIKDSVTGLPQSFAKQLLSPGALIGAGALGYQMLKGQQPLPDQSKLEGMANQLTPQAQQFMSYLQSGTLPPGMKAAVDQATNAAKAQAISQAAKQGASTDPTQNSQLQQQLAQIDQNALITVAQQGATLFSAGMSEMGLAEQIYANLMKMDYQQTQDMGKAIANFAASLAGNRGGVNINLGGTHA